MTLTIPASCFAVVGTACSFVVIARYFPYYDAKYVDYIGYGFPGVVVVATNFAKVHGIILGLAMVHGCLQSVRFLLNVRDDDTCGPHDQEDDDDDEPSFNKNHCAILAYVAGSCMLVATIMLCVIASTSRRRRRRQEVVAAPEAAAPPPGEPADSANSNGAGANDTNAIP